MKKLILATALLSIISCSEDDNKKAKGPGPASPIAAADPMTPPTSIPPVISEETNLIESTLIEHNGTPIMKCNESQKLNETGSKVQMVFYKGFIGGQEMLGVAADGTFVNQNGDVHPIFFNELYPPDSVESEITSDSLSFATLPVREGDESSLSIEQDGDDLSIKMALYGGETLTEEDLLCQRVAGAVSEKEESFLDWLWPFD